MLAKPSPDCPKPSNGERRREMIICPRCHGKGIILASWHEFFLVEVTCPRCNGSGKVEKDSKSEVIDIDG